MLHSKILAVTAFEAFFLAFVISYFQVPLPEVNLKDHTVGFFRDTAYMYFPRLLTDFVGLNHDTTPQQHASRSKARESRDSSSQKKRSDVADIKMLSAAELATYDGGKHANGVYLALLGKVYDVSSGSKHYGPGGGYHHFAGKDGTRAFVTGDFTPTGLTDDVTGMDHQAMLSIEDWISFYAKQYKFVGYVIGRYYDAAGRPTNAQKAVLRSLKAAHAWKEKQRAETERMPPCNSQWSAEKGGRVWCSTRSGGVERSWTGRPRRFYSAGSSDYKCVCASDDDLRHPNIREYDNCDSDAIECPMPDKKRT